ncbi:MAG TPA: pyridoxamine 5'-phosphate oxidase family protein [Tepidisphaeraceae bacterium]|nr:pyridoxamine 5'-phosphate oxidase family protein [Tepidisphaeraceae bacterium]
MQDTTQQSQNIEKLASLIKGVRIAMLTTTDGDGSLHSRPMATQSADFDGELWFLTGQRSHKVQEINRDHHVSLSYADPSDNRYVSISGTARLVRDRKRAEDLWNPMYKAWFPKGLDDPELCVLRVTPERAEYWDSPSSAVVHMVGFVKAALTGKPADAGEHGEMRLV